MKTVSPAGASCCGPLLLPQSRGQYSHAQKHVQQPSMDHLATSCTQKATDDAQIRRPRAASGLCLSRTKTESGPPLLSAAGARALVPVGGQLHTARGRHQSVFSTHCTRSHNLCSSVGLFMATWVINLFICLFPMKMK